MRQSQVINQDEFDQKILDLIDSWGNIRNKPENKFQQIKHTWWYRILQVLSVFYFILATYAFVNTYQYNNEVLSDPENYRELKAATNKAEELARDAIIDGQSRDEFAKEMTFYIKTTQQSDKEITDKIARDTLQSLLDAYDDFETDRLEVRWNEQKIQYTKKEIKKLPVYFCLSIVGWYVVRLIFLYIITGKLVWWGVKGEVSERDIEELELRKRKARLSKLLTQTDKE